MFEAPVHSVPQRHKPCLFSNAIPTGKELTAQAQILLSHGGDGRISLDSVSRRNRYGTATVPRPSEISFSSTTASNISPAAFTDVEQALGDLLKGLDDRCHIPRWFDTVRSEIKTSIVNEPCEIVLAASGTDAELIALGIAIGTGDRPITNIILAPDETGSGVPLAACGRHFQTTTSTGANVVRGERVHGFPPNLELVTISIRGPDGRPLDGAQIDQLVNDTAERALKQGRDVLLHVLDASKTGLTYPSRETAIKLRRSAPDRIHVVVDACQLRCRLSQIDDDISHGFIVIITGSKFGGGPAFCGALLLPIDIVKQLTGRAQLPTGLGHYSAELDWPPVLRTRPVFPIKRVANTGLGLRWIAALSSLKSLRAVDDGLQHQILSHFNQEVCKRATGIEGCRVVDSGTGTFASLSIVTIAVLDQRGVPAGAIQSQSIQMALRDPALGPVCHVGQTVALGDCNALRVAASASHVISTAASMTSGQSLGKAFQPISADLDVLFAKWRRATRRSLHSQELKHG